MRTWDSLYPDVLPYLPAGLPEPQVDRAILRALQELCQRTFAWRLDLPVITVSSGVLQYEVDTGLDDTVGAEVLRLERATLAGHPLHLWKPTDRTQPRGRYLFTTDGGRTVQLSHDPGEQPQALALTVTLKPRDGAIGLDDDQAWLLDRYSTEVADGVLGRLGRDGIAQARFDAACDRIHTAVWKGNAANSPRARASFF